MNIRKSFYRRKDKELALINTKANGDRVRAEFEYRREGAWEPGTAVETSRSIELGLIARAVARERVITGGEGSHQALAGISSPKRASAEFGKSLRERRGA